LSGSCLAPHSLQNFEPAGICAPHLMHVAAAAAAPPEVAAGAADSAFRCFIASVIAPAIAFPIAKPAPSPAPVPAPPPGFCAASRIAWAAWNCENLLMSPITPIEVRWSMAASTSCGREMFSTTNFVSSQPHHAEIRVAHHHGIRGAPLQIGELFRVDKINFRLERRVESVFPGAQLRQDGSVAALNAVAAGAKHVGNLSFINKDRRLRFAHNQLRAVLDLLITNRKAIEHRVAGI